jgi:hypothetical protein
MGALLFELAIFPLTSHVGRSPIDENPWTLHTIWEVAAIVGIVYVVKRMKLMIWQFLTTVGMCGIAALIVMAFVPFHHEDAGVRYCGVSYQPCPYSYEQGFWGVREIENDFWATNVYSLDDRGKLNSAILWAKRNSCGVALDYFYFWQTGMACGFDPLLVSVYGWRSDIFHWPVIRFLTIGPVVLVELLIRACIWFLPIFLMITIAWFLVRRKHLWLDEWASQEKIRIFENEKFDI